jgi:hypothetical protein
MIPYRAVYALKRRARSHRSAHAGATTFSLHVVSAVCCQAMHVVEALRQRPTDTGQLGIPASHGGGGVVGRGDRRPT